MNFLKIFNIAIEYYNSSKKKVDEKVNSLLSLLFYKNSFLLNYYSIVFPNMNTRNLYIW